MPFVPSEKIFIKTVTDTDLHPKLRANEMAITPVVCISPHGLTFNPGNPAIIELVKTIELNQNEETKLIPLLSDTGLSELPKWEEMGFGSCCKVNNDHIWFKTTHFSLFTVIARIPFPSASEEIQDSEGYVELTIPELPKFSVTVPPASIQSHTEVVVKATAYFDDHVVSAKRDGHTLASSCVALEPHGHKFCKPVAITLPIPDFAKVTETYPVAKLQLWHAEVKVEFDVNETTPINWEILTDSNIVISQDDEGHYVATVDINHFSLFQYMWNTVCYYCGVGGTSKTAVKSIQGRCQAFMSRVASLGPRVTFGLAVLIFPFQDPYLSLTNYDCVLMDSGDRALSLTLDSSGKINFRIELMPCLSYMFPASLQGQQFYSGSIALSQDCITRKDFVIKVESGIELKGTMPLGQLILTQQDNNDCSDHSLSLIKVSLVCVMVILLSTYKCSPQNGRALLFQHLKNQYLYLQFFFHQVSIKLHTTYS